LSIKPHPALSKGEGSKKIKFLNAMQVKVLSFGEDLSEAKQLY